MTTGWSKATLTLQEPMPVTNSVHSVTDWGAAELTSFESKIKNWATITVTLTYVTGALITTELNKYTAGCIFSVAAIASLTEGEQGVCFMGRKWGSLEEVEVFWAKYTNSLAVNASSSEWKTGISSVAFTATTITFTLTTEWSKASSAGWSNKALD